MSRPIVRPPPSAPPPPFHGIVTVAPQMRAVLEKIRRVARSDASVLLRGASGTGKELVASAIHAESPRATRPLRAVNCATFTASLLASELFGHRRGAFTGAVRDKPGLLALADGGSVFLDEVAEIPLELQPQLLRVLQEQAFVPVGGTSRVEVDVRLISATNTSLRRAVEAGRFREDLMYRVRVVVLFLPPLTGRTGDIGLLTWHFVDFFNRAQGYRQVEGLTRAAWDALHAYAWPGNVRELRNNIEQAFVLGEGPVVGLDDLAPELRGIDPPGAADLGEPATLREQERRRILRALDETGGRKGKAAELLGMDRSTLWRKIREHGL